MKSDVLSFLGRDNNSRQMPGKNDAKKVETGVKKQKRILNDYLKNLHLKFLSEELDIRIYIYILSFILQTASTSYHASEFYFQKYMPLPKTSKHGTQIKSCQVCWCSSFY